MTADALQYRARTGRKWMVDTRVVDLTLVAVLWLGALLVRLPDLQLIPAFSDETEELWNAMLIAQGRDLPLVDASTPYNGPVWIGLAALAYRLSGNSLYAPRTLVALLGALTVVATYLLGRAWAGRVGGVLAAALLATAGGHVALNSHLAWSNCTTPLFTTLASWTLWLAVGRPAAQSGRLLVLSAGLWGLALQTLFVLLQGLALGLLGCKPLAFGHLPDR
jgi:4-amino-4-deoxy-L-arabinose transferase-like glycosyltransferase